MPVVLFILWEKFVTEEVRVKRKSRTTTTSDETKKNMKKVRLFYMKHCIPNLVLGDMA